MPLLLVDYTISGRLYHYFWWTTPPLLVDYPLLLVDYTTTFGRLYHHF